MLKGQKIIIFHLSLSLVTFPKLLLIVYLLSLSHSFSLRMCGICLCVSVCWDYVCTVLPALRANSCIDFDRLMIELLDFHIPFLSFTNAGFKGYGKNLLNRRLRITLLP